jgi:6-phosphogluconolactonase
LKPERLDFPTREALAEALSARVAADLISGTGKRGSAALAVSGGSTPALFFGKLSSRGDVPWANVLVTLVDERWVDESSERSNARLVKETLLRHAAARARFLALYSGDAEPGPAGLARTAAGLDTLPRPFDAVVLGMGNDGHTASFFPGGDNLERALTEPGPVVSMHAEGAGEPRVTMTLPRLLDTMRLYLHIEGDQKARVLEQALADGPVAEMPIRAVLRQTQTPLTIFWSP